jgi:twitching motility protein PilI
MTEPSLNTIASAPKKQLLPTEALLRGFDLAVQNKPTVDSDADSPHVTLLEPILGTQARQGFSVGSLKLMIRHADGSELTELPKVYRLPNAPHWLIGMANLHGRLVPVFDLARYFNIELQDQGKPMLLVLGHGDVAAGIVIDGLPLRLRFEADQFVDVGAIPQSLAPVVQRAVLVNGQMWLDLDILVLLNTIAQSLGASQ